MDMSRIIFPAPRQYSEVRAAGTAALRAYHNGVAWLKLHEYLCTRLSHASQEPVVHSRPDATVARGSNRHGILQPAPPHRRLPRPVYENACRSEGFRRHQERRADTRVLRNGSDGGLRFEPDVAWRQSPRPYCW